MLPISGRDIKIDRVWTMPYITKVY